jgi:hypothetical protein
MEKIMSQLMQSINYKIVGDPKVDIIIGFIEIIKLYYRDYLDKHQIISALQYVESIYSDKEETK